MAGLEYVFTIQFLVCAMLAGIFFLVWSTIASNGHTLMWCFVYVGSAINMLMNGFKEFFPDLGLYWIVVNAVSLAVQALVIAGYRMRAEQTPLNRPLIALLVSAELLVIWFTIVTPHMGMRMVVIPWTAMIILCLCARILVTTRNLHDTLRPAELGAAITFVLYGLLQFAAGTAALMQGSERSDVYLDLYSQINFLSMPVSFVGTGLLTIIILHDDLMAKLKKLEGLLPICAYCKKIRSESGKWSSMESYISARTEASFSHGICPGCYEEVIQEIE